MLEIDRLTDGYDAKVRDQLQKDIARFRETGKLPEDNFGDCHVVNYDSQSPYWGWVNNSRGKHALGEEWEPKEGNPDMLVDEKTEEPHGQTRRGDVFYRWIHGGGLEALPENERFAFERVYISNVRQEDVAEEMGISQAKVSRLLSRVKARIAREVGL